MPGAIKLVDASAFYPQSAVLGGWVARTDYYNDNKEVLGNIIRAWADANDYIAIASRLANDSAWRERVARTIRDGLGALFDRQEPVRAFGELLLQRA